ncbi:hypothetical protein [Clostridium perfringens]|uniref:right-handed parallel beta-helix repeat-containing protein n=1 Tax=Clostridium perfringens TaxID=1502 RepID=UPI003F41E558
MNNLEQIVCQYYKDKDGNPMSYHIRRKHQISPKNFQIQLDGIPDEYKGIEVIEPNGFSRVYNSDEITENTYWVRDDGNVFFHKSMACKEVMLDYYSIGLPVVGVGRIYTLLDEEGNVIETLEDILKKGQTVIEALKTMNDVIIAIDELKTSTYEGIKVINTLDEKIDEGYKLLVKLNSSEYVKRKEFDDAFKDMKNNFEKDKGDFKLQLENSNNNITDISNLIKKQSYICDDNDDIGLCVNKAISEGYRTIKIPSGKYILKTSIILKDNLTLFGDKNTVIETDKNIPMITTSKTQNDWVNTCYIHDLWLINHNKDLQFYHMDLCNVNMTKLERIRIETDITNSIHNVGGITAYYNGDFVGEGGAYSLCIDKCDLRSSSIYLGITDCYISKTNVWGKNRDFALWINSSSQQISNCQFVGGQTYGAIYIKNKNNYDVETLKINNCYFDGSYGDIQSGIGLNAYKMRNSNVSNCSFWHQKDSAICLTDCFGNTITNCNFSENGSNNKTQNSNNVKDGIYDIKFNGLFQANIISNNTHVCNESFYIKPKMYDFSGVTKSSECVFSNNIIFNNGLYDNDNAIKGINNVRGKNCVFFNIGTYNNWYDIYLPTNVSINGEYKGLGTLNNLNFGMTIDNSTTFFEGETGLTLNKYIFTSQAYVEKLGVLLDSKLDSGSMEFTIKINGEDYARMNLGNYQWNLSDFPRFHVNAGDVLSLVCTTNGINKKYKCMATVTVKQ